MKPQTALNLKYDPTEEYTRAQIEALRDEWIAAYRSIAEDDPSKKELCERLTERISRAAELFIGRNVEPPVSDATNHDDYYYEWLDEVKQEQDAELDGDFPLGNQTDMEFASPYFSIKEFALIHTGRAADIYAGYYVEYADRVLVRRGILAEAMGDLGEAIGAYSGVTYSKTVQRRENLCRRRLRGEE